MLKNLTVIIFLLSLAICATTAGPSLVLAAANFSASPLIIDYTTEGRDIINRDIILTNNTNRPTRIYASVHEVEVEVGEEAGVHEFVTPSMTDRSTTITSWLEISRARLELPANGTLTVPLTIRIHPNTPPGTYHALIGFATGPNRDDIEAKVISGQAASVILKITIKDDKREQLHLVSFATDRFTLRETDNKLSFTIENTGDIPLTPEGDVIIYDTSGKELASLNVNSGKVTIAPGERVQIYEDLPFINRIGRNKAYLTLQYGENQATVFDTAFYYSIPWYYLFIIFTLLALILSLVAWVFKRAFTREDREDDQLYDLPMFVKNSREHTEYDHDINLKNDKQSS